MIKINLSPQRRSKTVDKGQQSASVGFLALVLVVGLLYLLVQRPLGEDIEKMQVSTRELSQDNAAKRKELEGFEKLKKTIALAQERRDVILRLNRARAVPAHMLHELSRILTPKRLPTMSERMEKEMTDNPNRELALDWDPSRVWITKFEEKDGAFTLEGGAQADSDMTQLALRMQASVYFLDVVPEGGSEQVDQNSGNPFYKFTITGKVAY